MISSLRTLFACSLLGAAFLPACGGTDGAQATPSDAGDVGAETAETAAPKTGSADSADAGADAACVQRWKLISNPASKVEIEEGALTMSGGGLLDDDLSTGHDHLALTQSGVSSDFDATIEVDALTTSGDGTGGVAFFLDTSSIAFVAQPGGRHAIRFVDRDLHVDTTVETHDAHVTLRIHRAHGSTTFSAITSDGETPHTVSVGGGTLGIAVFEDAATAVKARMRSFQFTGLDHLEGDDFHCDSVER